MGDPNSYNAMPKGLVVPAPPPPRTRLCMTVDCPRRYRHETLTGLRFCAEHFGDFYSPDTPPYNPERG